MIENVTYAGWPNSLRLANDHVELVATTAVGPRVIHFGPRGGPNLFKVFDETRGRTGGEEWHSYGGHRFWHAPEEMPRTYAPDNGPVDHAWDGHTLLLSVEEPVNGIAKQIAIRLAPDAPRVEVRHRLVNRNAWAIELAPWALTVMAPGGRLVVPQEEYRPHPESLTPARPVVIWHYTDMSDQRWTWGPRYLQLRQDAAATTKLKAGVLNTRGWAAYLLDGHAFIKRYPFVPGATYPDMGVNTEAYTDAEILEVETLGPLTRLEPGAHVEHVETWVLTRYEAGTSEDELDAHLLPVVGP